MSFQNIQSLDALSVGRTPGFWPRLYDRVPTGNDIGFLPGQFWINKTTNQVYYLEDFTTSGGITQANWVLLTNAGFLQSISDNANNPAFPSGSGDTPPLNIQFKAGAGISVTTTSGPPDFITITNTAIGSITLTGDSGGAASPSGGNINTISSVVANGTNSAALKVIKTAGATLNWEQQVTTTNASADVSKAGVASFNSAQFQVSGGNEGFISLKGSTSNAPILGIIPDANTAPGTSPVLANVSGNITLEGGAMFNTGTQANPIRTNSLAANKIDIQIQRAGSNSGSAAANNFGVSQFDSDQFNVSSGFVQINNSVTGVVTKLKGDDGVTVTPTSGVITMEGNAVANGTHPARPVYFLEKPATTDTERLDIQVATSSTSGAKSINNAGLASFDNTQFLVDSSTGFVQAITALNFPSQPSTRNLGITYSGGTFTVTSADGTALSPSNPGYVTMESAVSPGLFVTYTIEADQSFQDSAGVSTIAGNTFGVSCAVGSSWDEDMPFYLYAVSNSSAGSPETDVNFMICRLPNITFTQGAGTIGKTGSAVATTQGSFFALGNPTVADYANSAALCIGAFRMRSTTNIADWTVQTLSIGSTSSGTSLKIMADGIGQFHEGTKFWQPLGVMGNLTNSIFSLSGAPTITPGSRPISYSISRGGIINIYATFQVSANGTGSNQLRYNLPFVPVGGAAGAGGIMNSYVTSMTVDGNVAYSTFLNSSSTSFMTNPAVVTGRTYRFGCVYNARFI